MACYTNHMMPGYLSSDQTVPDLLGQKKPNPKEVEDKTNACLQKEFQPLADLAVPIVLVIARDAILLSDCEAPSGFDDDVLSITQNTLNQFVFYEANNCSDVVRDETAKAIKKPWNILTQTLCEIAIDSAVQVRLNEGVLNAVSNSVSDIQSVAQCEDPDFPDTLASLLKVFYDRVAFVGATITLLNVVNIFANLPGCVTLPVIDLTVPV